jgi:biotin transport system substrate-specific component
MATQSEAVDLIEKDLVENIARMALFGALMGAFAFVSFPYPLSPAPVTLQVLGVFLAGIMLGPVWGAGAMILYLLAGAVGAPVFANASAGLGVILGPTGGYLLSYPIAAAVIGFVVHRGVELRDYRSAGLPVLVGAMVAMGHAEGVVQQIIGFIAVFLAAGNAVGGYFVTERMLEMFKSSGDQENKA